MHAEEFLVEDDELLRVADRHIVTQADGRKEGGVEGGGVDLGDDGICAPCDAGVEEEAGEAASAVRRWAAAQAGSLHDLPALPPLGRPACKGGDPAPITVGAGGLAPSATCSERLKPTT